MGALLARAAAPAPDVLLLAGLRIADQHAAVGEQLQTSMVAVGQLQSVPPPPRIRLADRDRSAVPTTRRKHGNTLPIPNRRSEALHASPA